MRHILSDCKQFDKAVTYTGHELQRSKVIPTTLHWKDGAIIRGLRQISAVYIKMWNGLVQLHVHIY